MFACIILSSLALAAASACVVATFTERKRNRECNAALADKCKDALKQLHEQVEALENGALPDYEKAKAAAKAVNDFHEGIANILNFDPYKRAQEGNRGDGE